MKKRNGKIDFLRLFFAVIIVLHHSRYVLGYEESIFIGGSLAVEFFFIVSGYLMMAHIAKLEGAKRPAARLDAGNESNVSGVEDMRLGSETYHYLMRKIRGFLPEFLFAVVIGFLFTAAAERWSAAETLQHFIQNFGEYTLLKMSGIFQNGIDGVMWYLSAMLIAMAILYPLIRRYPDMMEHVGLPLITILILGFLCQMEDSPRDPTVWMGIAYKGLLRAIAEISLGGICYLACRHFKALRLSRAGKGLVTAAEILCYALPVGYMYLQKPSRYDYFFIFLLFLGVLLSFSGQGLLAGVFDEDVAAGSATPTKKNPATRKSLWSLCSGYSTALFLSHIYFAQHINAIFAEDRYSAAFRMAWYLGLSFLNGFVVMKLSGLVREKSGRLRSFFTGIFTTNAAG